MIVLAVGKGLPIVVNCSVSGVDTEKAWCREGQKLLSSLPPRLVSHPHPPILPQALTAITAAACTLATPASDTCHTNETNRKVPVPIQNALRVILSNGALKSDPSLDHESKSTSTDLRASPRRPTDSRSSPKPKGSRVSKVTPARAVQKSPNEGVVKEESEAVKPRPSSPKTGPDQGKMYSQLESLLCEEQMNPTSMPVAAAASEEDKMETGNRESSASPLHPHGGRVCVVDDTLPCQSSSSQEGEETESGDGVNEAGKTISDLISRISRKRQRSPILAAEIPQVKKATPTDPGRKPGSEVKARVTVSPLVARTAAAMTTKASMSPVGSKPSAQGSLKVTPTSRALSILKAVANSKNSSPAANKALTTAAAKLMSRASSPSKSVQGSGSSGVQVIPISNQTDPALNQAIETLNKALSSLSKAGISLKASATASLISKKTSSSSSQLRRPVQVVPTTTGNPLPGSGVPLEKNTIQQKPPVSVAMSTQLTQLQTSQPLLKPPKSLPLDSKASESAGQTTTAQRTEGKPQEGMSTIEVKKDKNSESGSHNIFLSHKLPVPYSDSPLPSVSTATPHKPLLPATPHEPLIQATPHEPLLPATPHKPLLPATPHEPLLPAKPQTFEDHSTQFNVAPPRLDVAPPIDKTPPTSSVASAMNTVPVCAQAQPEQDSTSQSSPSSSKQELSVDPLPVPCDGLSSQSGPLASSLPTITPDVTKLPAHAAHTSSQTPPLPCSANGTASSEPSVSHLSSTSAAQEHRKLQPENLHCPQLFTPPQQHVSQVLPAAGAASAPVHLRVLPTAGGASAPEHPQVLPTAGASAPEHPQVLPTAGASAPVHLQVLPTAGASAPVHLQVLPSAEGASAPVPQVLPKAGASAPVPQVLPKAGAAAPIPQVLPKAGAAAPIPQVLPKAGAAAPVPRVLPSAGVLGPVRPQVLPTAGAAAPLPQVLPTVGASASAHPQVLPSAGVVGDGCTDKDLSMEVGPSLNISELIQDASDSTVSSLASQLVGLEIPLLNMDLMSLFQPPTPNSPASSLPLFSPPLEQPLRSDPGDTSQLDFAGHKVHTTGPVGASQPSAVSDDPVPIAVPLSGDPIPTRTLSDDPVPTAPLESSEPILEISTLATSKDVVGSSGQGDSAASPSTEYLDLDINSLMDPSKLLEDIPEDMAKSIQTIVQLDEQTWK